MQLIRGVGGAQALATGSGSVWVAEANEDDLRQVDPVVHNVSASIPIGGAAAAITVADGAIWAVTPAGASSTSAPMRPMPTSTVTMRAL